MVEAPVDFYELLGVDPEASVPDIKAAYRALLGTSGAAGSRVRLCPSKSDRLWPSKSDRFCPYISKGSLECSEEISELHRFHDAE